jgi:hypothetical protein
MTVELVVFDCGGVLVDSEVVVMHGFSPMPWPRSQPDFGGCRE